MSRAGGRDVAVAMCDCGISTTSQTRFVCKHCFSALLIDKTSSVEAQIRLLWRSFCSSSYRVWDYLRGILKRPSWLTFSSMSSSYPQINLYCQHQPDLTRLWFIMAYWHEEGDDRLLMSDIDWVSVCMIICAIAWYEPCKNLHCRQVIVCAVGTKGQWDISI